MKTTNYFMSEISDSFVQAAIYKNLIFFGLVALGVILLYFCTQRIAKRHVPRGVWNRNAYNHSFGYPDEANCTILWSSTLILFLFLLVGSLGCFCGISKNSKTIYKIQNGIIWKSFNEHPFEKIEYDYVLYIKFDIKNSGEGVVDLELLKLIGEGFGASSFKLHLRFQENPEEVRNKILKRIPQERFLSKFKLK